MPDRCNVLLKYPDGYREAWMELEIMGDKTFLVMAHYPTADDPPLRIEIDPKGLEELNWPTIRWGYRPPIEPPAPWTN